MGEDIDDYHVKYLNSGDDKDVGYRMFTDIKSIIFEGREVLRIISKGVDKITLFSFFDDENFIQSDLNDESDYSYLVFS